ncbi:MAG: hypothetical protein GDA35_01705 [Hyphomonadaceae bacterium]|nr:hypothetical protein [Hyphomonadaceae bacterium]
MMPFDAAFDPVFEAVKQAGQDMGLQVSRADQVWKNSEVIQDIFSLIFRSRFVICDFSDKNPNVFYEAGIAHTLGRPVIPVAQNKDDIPFDIGHHRYVIYDNTEQGRDGLIRNIRSRMKDLAQNNAV